MPKNNTAYKKHVIKPLKRIGAFIADFIIFMMVSISLYALAITPLIKTITPYKTYVAEQQESFNACKTLLMKSHLVEYDENDKEVRIEQSFEKNLKDRLDGKVYDQNGHYIDIFLHFYVTFCESSIHFSGSTKNYSVQYVNENIYHINDENNILFSLTEDNINLPLSFSDNAKKQLNDYYSGEVNGESQKYHDTFITLMTESWNNATQVLIDSDEYTFSAEQYGVYSNKVLEIYSYSSIIFYTIMFFIYYLLVPFFIKKGQTPAKKILHIGLFDDENNPVKFKTVVFKSLMLYFFMFFGVILLPTMDLGLSIIYLPLFTIGAYTFNLFLLAIVMLMLTIISGVYMCIDKNHQSFHDKMLNIYLLKDNVDLNEEVDNRPSNVIEQENFDRGSSIQ